MAHVAEIFRGEYSEPLPSATLAISLRGPVRRTERLLCSNRTARSADFAYDEKRRKRIRTDIDSKRISVYSLSVPRDPSECNT